MPTYQSIPNFKHGDPEATGILVVNLGTPEAPTASAVRRFLKQFLWDPRVVEYPRVLWWLILNLIILTIRPSRSAAAYQKIWTEQGSPLLLHSQQIVDKLQQRFAGHAAGPIEVELAMSYSEPSIDNAIDSLIAKGARRVVTLPLYPQYSATTTASVYDAVANKMQQLRWIPESRFINNYHDTPEYISALADSVRQHWASHGRGDKLLLSFHGVPKSTLLKGDPYHCQCQKTGRLLAEALELDDDAWLLTFQSRVGREQWLTPYTDQTIKDLGANGASSLDVICPGFSTDCLETLEEIAMQNAEFFIEAGGKSLQYIPCLNASDAQIGLLSSVIERHLLGWLPVPNEESGMQTRTRAEAMGANQ